METALVTLNDLEGHSLVAGLLSAVRWTFCAAFYQISIDSMLTRSVSDSWASCQRLHWLCGSILTHCKVFQQRRTGVGCSTSGPSRLHCVVMMSTTASQQSQVHCWRGSVICMSVQLPVFLAFVQCSCLWLQSPFFMDFGNSQVKTHFAIWRLTLIGTYL